MKWVVCYDIESDDVRERVARILERHGERVQRSVFECDVDSEHVRLLGQAVSNELGEDPGNVRFYRLCRACRDEAFGVGRTRGTSGSEPYLIV